MEKNTLNITYAKNLEKQCKLREASEEAYRMEAEERERMRRERLARRSMEHNA